MRPTLSSLWKQIYLFQWLKDYNRSAESPLSKKTSYSLISDLTASCACVTKETHTRHKEKYKREIQKRRTEETSADTVRPTHDTKSNTSHKETLNINKILKSLTWRRATRAFFARQSKLWAGIRDVRDGLFVCLFVSCVSLIWMSLCVRYSWEGRAQTKWESLRE